MKDAFTDSYARLYYRVRNYFLGTEPIYEKRNSDYGMRKIWGTGAKTGKEKKKRWRKSQFRVR
jgi:hypothetical protein